MIVPRQANLENKIKKMRGVHDVLFTQDNGVIVTLCDWSMRPVISLWLNTLFDKRGLTFNNVSYLYEPSAPRRKRMPMMRRIR